MRVLLVTHEASRTGAPRIAVLVAKSLVEQGHTVEVVSRRPGPLLEEFAAIGPTSVERLYRLRRKLWSSGVSHAIAIVVDTALAMATLLRRRPDMVYVNSAAAAVYIRPARWLGRRAVLHVHESGELVRQFVSHGRAPRRLDGVMLIACSPSVALDLGDLTGRGTDTIPVLPSVPDVAQVRRLAESPPDLDYSPEELVVGCCGTVEHRKGADLWVAVAREVRNRVPGRIVRFVWIGKIVEPVGLDGPPGVEFVGLKANPYAHLRRFDVATLPSRDDPFPLAVMESMALGTPVVAFDVGGVSQQIGDAGVVVPTGDVAAFAVAVSTLLLDAEKRARLGVAARERINTLYSTRAFSEGLLTMLSSPSAAQRTKRP